MRTPARAAALAVALAGAADLAACFSATAAPPRILQRGSAAPPTVLVVADVRESAQATMPAELWRTLAAGYAGGATIAAADATTLPDQEQCRAAHAAYAVLATFERAPRLPGVAQDTDRAYGIARFTVRNCATGAVMPERTVRIESDPLAEPGRTDSQPDARRVWERAVHAALAHDQLLPRVTSSPVPRP